ncbi:MAG TPA: BatA domain-containing protein [Planctomycetota bacterium]|nr:BatA domain-containing protein [Planctomycetota bacterium]
MAATPFAAAALVDGFVHPALAAGVALAAVPLAIHLLNRQRHRPMAWAAMRFVLAAYKKTRRRVELENLLLLLLRMAAVAALALAVARPFTGVTSPLAGLTESRRDVAIVIDASASTAYGGETETTFERIVDRARELVGELDGGRGDRVRLLQAGAWPRLLSWTNPADALAMLDLLEEPTDETLDLAAALGEVLRFAEEEAAGTDQSRVEIHLLCDLQRNTFIEIERAPEKEGADGAAQAPRLSDVLDALNALGTRVAVEDLGPPVPRPPNLGVVSVETAGPVAGPGTPVELRVGLRNFGTKARAGVRVALVVDGDRRPSQIVSVPGRGQAQVVFPLVFERTGDHALTAVLEGDRLAVDDERVVIVRVPEPVRVLVVNGGPARELERDAAGFLMAVLSPLDEDGPGNFLPPAPFVAEQRGPHDLEDEEIDLTAFDVIWTVDVDGLAPQVVRRIEERVADGATLICGMGPRVDLEHWNTRAWRADGSGLLPAELLHTVSVRSRSESYYRVREFDAEHPALRFFADERWRAFLTEVPIYDFVATRAAPNARVLASLDDEGAHPLLIERAFDRGRVLLWTTSFDASWTRLPVLAPQAFIPLVHELTRHGGDLRPPPIHLAPGAGVVAEVDAFPRNLQLLRPDGTRREVEGEVVELDRNRWRLPAVEGAETERTGLYTLASEGGGAVLFAVHLDPGEGDLERIEKGELEGLHEALKMYAPRAGDAAEGGAGVGQRGELWRWMAGACLLALVAEALWAGWIGRRRRLA